MVILHVNAQKCRRASRRLNMCCTGTTLHSGIDESKRGAMQDEGFSTGHWMSDYYGIWWEVVTTSGETIWKKGDLSPEPFLT